MRLVAANERRDLATEELFREVNEKIVRLNQVFEAPAGEFLCECAESSCAERLLLSLEDYDEIRADPRRFLMATGHERPGARVVAHRDGYEVVETTLVRPRPRLSLALH